MFISSVDFDRNPGQVFVLGAWLAPRQSSLADGHPPSGLKATDSPVDTDFDTVC